LFFRRFDGRDAASAESTSIAIEDASAALNRYVRVMKM
jgi:hypothetical protein